MIKKRYTAPVAELEEAEFEFAFLADSNSGTAPELEEGWAIEW